MELAQPPAQPLLWPLVSFALLELTAQLVLTIALLVLMVLTPMLKAVRPALTAPWRLKAAARNKQPQLNVLVAPKAIMPPQDLRFAFFAKRAFILETARLLAPLALQVKLVRTSKSLLCALLNFKLALSVSLVPLVSLDRRIATLAMRVPGVTSRPSLAQGVLLVSRVRT